MALVGVIANPAASKDIRRLVAQGRVVPDWEKVNIVKTCLAWAGGGGHRPGGGPMPDSSQLVMRARDDRSLSLNLDLLEMPGLLFRGRHGPRRVADGAGGRGLPDNPGRRRHQPGGCHGQHVDSDGRHIYGHEQCFSRDDRGDAGRAVGGAGGAGRPCLWKTCRRRARRYGCTWTGSTGDMALVGRGPVAGAVRGDEGRYGT